MIKERIENFKSVQKKRKETKKVCIFYIMVKITNFFYNNDKIKNLLKIKKKRNIKKTNMVLEVVNRQNKLKKREFKGHIK